MYKMQMLCAIQEALDTNRCFAIAIKNNELKEEEIIINPNSNLANKLKYYSEAYCGCCRLKSNRDIEIVAYASGRDKMEALTNITHKLKGSHVK